MNPASGVYYDERGKPMLGSSLVRDPEFQDHVAETRSALDGLGLKPGLDTLRPNMSFYPAFNYVCQRR